MSTQSSYRETQKKARHSLIALESCIPSAEPKEGMSLVTQVQEEQNWLSSSPQTIPLFTELHKPSQDVFSCLSTHGGAENLCH